MGKCLPVWDDPRTRTLDQKPHRKPTDSLPQVGQAWCPALTQVLATGPTADSFMGRVFRMGRMLSTGSRVQYRGDQEVSQCVYASSVARAQLSLGQPAGRNPGKLLAVLAWKVWSR